MRNNRLIYGWERGAQGAWLLLGIAICLSAKFAYAQAAAKKPLPGQQPAATAGDSQQLDDITGLFIADRTLLVDLSRAKKLIDERQYGDAVLFLHRLLESPDDAAFSTDKTNRMSLRSLRLEAERLLGEMPVAGIQLYQRLYGAEAKALLKTAVEKIDLEMLAKTSNCYFHTKAGREATYMLATIHLEHNRPLEAAVCFERLRRNRSVDMEERAVLVFQNAVAWLMAEMPQAAKDCLTELKKLNPDGSIFLGDRKVALPADDRQSLAWLESLMGARDKSKSSPAHRWTMFRGNASRTAQVATITHLSKAAWQVSTCSWQVPVELAPFSNGKVSVARQIEGLVEGFHKDDLAAIPATAPLIVGDVLLSRSLSKLQAFDTATGQLKWQAEETNALEQVRRGTVPPLPGDTGSILDPMLLDRIFTSSTHGTLSAGRELVFSLESLGFANPKFVGPRRLQTAASHPLALKSYNHLSAYEIGTGKRKWRAGGDAEQSKDVLAGHFFLGPPLPLAGRLYCLVEVSKRIRLVVLEAQTGKLLWSKSLLAVELDVTQDLHRGQSGLSPSFADGVLICPTSSGAVVAIDLATRRFMWSYRYREIEEGDPRTRQMRRMAMIRLAAMRGEPAQKENPGHWLDSLPFISGTHVIITPRDAEELYCLDLSDGSLLWKMPRESHLYIGGVRDGKLLMVGNRQLQLFDLNNGKSIWAQPTHIPHPSGRGILAGDRYLIPLSTSEIATVNLQDGRILSREKCEDGIIPGNLVSSGGIVISQGMNSLLRFQHSDSSKATSTR